MTKKTILKKASGNITISAFNAGDKAVRKISAFDTYVQIIEGMAILFINENKYQLRVGEGIIIPAHSAHIFNAEENFKMISTVLKSGYENTRSLFI